MPDPPAYSFVPDPHGQRQNRRELQRAVRSHAATVSYPHDVPRRRTRQPRLGQGESVLALTPRDDSATEQRDSVESGQATDPSRRTFRLFTDILSGNTFSPIAYLDTFHKPYVPGIINHYIYQLTIPTPQIDDTSAAPLFRGTWVPIIIHDPLLFEIIVLFAATHYATFAVPAQYQDLYQELLVLKQSALRALIRTVQSEDLAAQESTASGNNEVQGCSDTLIAAAAKMASYEAIFGSIEAFHFHMSVVARLLHTRRGIATLGMNGFLAPLLTFVDVNSAVLLGSTTYLDEFGLSGHMPQRQPVGPNMFNNIATQIRRGSQRSDTVNLERFVGSMRAGSPR